MHPSIAYVEETRYVQPKRKELRVLVTTPSHAEHEIRHHCTYTILGTKGPYHLIYGTWGPFREIYYASLTAGKGDPRPWMTVSVDGKMRPVWVGLWTGLEDLPNPQATRFEVISGKATPRYVNVTYSNMRCRGNLHHTWVEADELAEQIRHYNLNWKVVDISWRWNVSTLEVAVKRPGKTGHEVYPNAHTRDTTKTWVGAVHWAKDDWVEPDRVSLGYNFKSEEEARQAVNSFTGPGKQESAEISRVALLAL